MLKVLRYIIQEVNNAESLREALAIIVHHVIDALETGACAIFLMDHEHHKLVLSAADGLEKNLISKLKIPVSQGLIGFVAERKEAVNVMDARLHERFYEYPGAGEEKFNAFLGVPILHRKRLLGVIVVEQEEARKYDAAEEAFLMTLAIQLASVIVEVGGKDILEAVQQDDHDLPEVLRGTPGSSGVGIGEMVVVYSPADLDAVPDQETDAIEEEIEKFMAAIEATRN